MLVGALTAVIAATLCAAGAVAAYRPVSAAPATERALAAGGNDFGQLGDGTRTGRATPVGVVLPEDVTLTQVAAGSRHSLGVTSDGRVLAWGDNGSGQLGDGTATYRATPVEVALPDGVTVTQVAAGAWHSLALTSDDRVLAWGGNGFGQVGDGTTTTRAAPVRVALPEGVTVSQVAAGDGGSHSLALTSDGRVLSWGLNDLGQLGNGTRTRRTVPGEVAMPAGVTATQVDGGRRHGLALTSGGGVLAWGGDDHGTLGNGPGNGPAAGAATPVRVALPAGATVIGIAAGSDHSLAVTADGPVLAWGRNTSGRLGDGTTTDRSAPVEVALPDGVIVTQVDGGDSGGFAVTSGGRVLAWGGNDNGQLGDGTTTGRTIPVPMALPDEVSVTQVAAGGVNTLALTRPRNSGTSLAADPGEAAEGEQVALTAKVTCTGGTPNGTVTFLDGGAMLGASGVDRSGGSILTAAGLAAGPHDITARYEGGSACSPSTSDPVTVNVGVTALGTTPGPVAPGRLVVDGTADRTEARVGEEVRYTIRVANTGGTALTRAEVTAHLTDVLDNGELAGPITATKGKVAYGKGPAGRTGRTGPAIAWTGELAPGRAADITFTVKATAPGLMRNRVTWLCATPRTRGGECSDRTSTRVA